MSTRHILFAIALGSLLCLAGRAETILLDPASRPIVIVTPAQPNNSVKTAANELAEHFELATGVKPQRLTANDALPDGCFAFRLGLDPADATLGHQHANWRCDADSLSITGNDAGPSLGTMMATYEFLDKVLGCRWLWPGELGRVVPKTSVITLETGSGIYKPSLRCTVWRPNADRKHLWKTYKGWEHFFSYQQQWFYRNRAFNDMSLQNYPHGFEDWYERFSETHPEYFQMLPNGERKPDPYYISGAPSLISMCVSNPGFIRQAVQDWLDDFNPAWPMINALENDTAGRCCCDNCLAWDDSPEPAAERRARALKRFEAGDEQWYTELGSVTNRYAKFYLALLAEADRVAPEKHAELASDIYANYSEPPSPSIALGPRVYPRFCPPLMFPWNEEKIQRYLTQWQGWADTGCLMLLRPNYTLDGHCFPINYARNFTRCFRFCYDRNMVGVDMDSCPGNYSAMGITMYAIIRIMCHPELTDEQIYGEYESAFGAAAPILDRYFQRLEDLSNSFNTNETLKQNASIVGGNYAGFFTFAPVIYTPEVFAELYAMLDEAAAATADDELITRRIAWLRLGIEHAELTAKTQHAYEGYLQTKDLTEFGDAIDALDTFRDAHEKDHLSNFGWLRFMENLTWPNRDFVKLQRQNVTRLPDKWHFRTDPDKTGLEQGWAEADFDFSGWDLFSIEQPWEPQLGGPYDGFGWYRIDITLPEELPGTPQIIFGAVDEACKIWCNGKLIHDRPYVNSDDWTTPFTVSFAEFAQPGATLKIAVRVEDNGGAGGIWKPCFLKFEKQ